MSLIQVKEAGTPDAALIADISRKTFYETFAAVNTKENMDKFMNEQFSKALLMEEVGAPGNHFLLAYLNGEAVGYVKMKEGEELPEMKGYSSIELVRIYALNKVIGQGVGQALMQASLDLAAKLGKEVIWLGVWERNERAIRFYEKWGYTRFSQHNFILGDDVQLDWLMMRTV